MFLCLGASRPLFPQADAWSGLRPVMLRRVMLLPLLRQQYQKLHGCSGGSGERARIIADSAALGNEGSHGYNHSCGLPDLSLRERYRAKGGDGLCLLSVPVTFSVMCAAGFGPCRHQWQAETQESR